MLVLEFNTNSLASYYTCVHTRKDEKEHCVKGVYSHPGVTLIATPMPPLPFFLEKQIFELRFPNHVLHPGLIVTPPALPVASHKPKDEIY